MSQLLINASTHVVLELVPSHAHHDITMGTRDELTGVGSLFRFDTEQHLLRDLLAQQVARHDVADMLESQGVEGTRTRGGA